MNGNNLEEFSELGSKKLLTINFSNNSLKLLPSSMDVLQDQYRLEELLLSNNQISEQELSKFHFKGLVNLEKLDLSVNSNIKYLGHNVFQYNEKLRFLNISKTGLKTLDSLGSEYFETIDFSWNNIEKIEASDFSGLTKLLSLDLSHNKLKTVQKNLFQDLTSLLELNLSHNKIETIDASNFNGLQRLQSLDLSFNFISELSTIKYLKSLKFLYLQNNKIIVIPCSQQLPQAIEILDISFNQLFILKGINKLHLKEYNPYELRLNTSCPWYEFQKLKSGGISEKINFIYFVIILSMYI